MACSSVWAGGKREPPKTANGLYSFLECWHRSHMGHVAMAQGPDGMLKCLDRGQWGATKHRKRPLRIFIVLAQAPYGPCSCDIGGRWHAQVFGQGARGSHQKPQAALYFLVLAEAPYGPCGYIWHRAPMTCSSVWTGGKREPPKTANCHYSFL